MPTLLASYRRGKEKKLPVICSDRPTNGIEPRVRGTEPSSSPKFPSEPPAQAELLILIPGAGEDTTQRSRANREARFQNRTDRNRAPDSNGSSKAVPGTRRVWWIQTWAIREGFQEEENLAHGKKEEQGRRELFWVRNRAYSGELTREQAMRDAKISVEMEEMESTPGSILGGWKEASDKLTRVR